MSGDSEMFLFSVLAWVNKVEMKVIYVQLCAAAQPPDAVCRWTSLRHVCVLHTTHRPSAKDVMTHLLQKLFYIENA